MLKLFDWQKHKNDTGLPPDFIDELIAPVLMLSLEHHL